MDVGSVTGVSEVHAAAIFWVEICMVGDFLCTYSFMFGGGGYKLTPHSCQQKRPGKLQKYRNSPF